MSSRGVAQFGRVPEWGSGGRRFESSHSDHLRINLLIQLKPTDISGFLIFVVGFNCGKWLNFAKFVEFVKAIVYGV